MAVGFSSYQIARSGLTVNERGLYVTGHNMSNVDTAGYVRQQSVIETSPYQTTYGKNNQTFQYGLGADIQETRQIRHSFLDIIYRQENTSLGYHETRSKAVEDIQAILNDPMGDGLQNVMNQFWDSWQELSKTPESLTTRALVRERGQTLVYYFNQVGSQLDRLQNDLNSEIQVQVEDINEITSKVAALNQKISSQEIVGDSANDYRDQRNLLLDQLSKICDADVTERQDGQVDITLGGYYLVTRNTSKNLYVEANSDNGGFYYPMLEGTKTVVNVKNGTLKGLLESRGEVSGIKGNYANGTPNEKIDINFAIDTSAGSAYLTNLKASISSYVNDLKKSGVDFNIRFISMDGTSSVYGPDTVYDANSIDNFLDPAILDTFFSETGGSDGSFGGLVSTLKSISDANGFRQDAAKVTYVFSDKSVDGDSSSQVTDASGYVNTLKSIGMKTSVITTESYYTQGQDATEVGWNDIAYGTGGNVFEMGTDVSSFKDLGLSINGDTRAAVNAASSNIPASKNIVSELKRKLNAMLNTVAREVNYLSKTGYTLDGKAGVAFFKAVDDKYPMQMGNINLSDDLLSDKGLNNIIASGLSDAVGDNTIARKIANMRDIELLEDSTGDVTVDEYYRSIILDIGNKGSEATTAADNQKTLTQSADDQRNAISGVSLDEEMSNMMKYKFAYDASARVLNIIDSMVEKVVNSLGVVGR